MIFRPIDQVGWASASSGVTRASSVARAAAERAAGRGQHERRDGVGSTSLEALEERRVLAVDRQQQAAPPPLGGDGELAGGDEALLVRERERDAALERPERRPDAGEADDRVEDESGSQASSSAVHVAADLGVLDAVRGGELVERLRAGHQRAQLELGVRCHDLDRLPRRSSR